MVDDRGTRDMAIRAAARIESHEEVCTQRYKEWASRQDQTLTYIKEMSARMEGFAIGINTNIAELKLRNAEYSGASKFAKLVGHAITATVGLLGGIFGGSFIHK